MHIKYAGAYSSLFQYTRRMERFIQKWACSDDCHPRFRTTPEVLRLPCLKRCFCCCEYRSIMPSKTDVRGFVICYRCVYSLSRFFFITRHKYRYVWEYSHECNIFERLMRRSVGTYGYSRMHTHYLDGQIRNGNRSTYLLPVSSWAENSIRRDTWYFPIICQTRCNGSKILFCNTNLDIPFRIFFFKCRCLYRFTNVGTQNHNLLISCTCFKNSFTKATS